MIHGLEPSWPSHPNHPLSHQRHHQPVTETSDDKSNRKRGTGVCHWLTSFFGVRRYAAKDEEPTRSERMAIVIISIDQER